MEMESNAYYYMLLHMVSPCMSGQRTTNGRCKGGRHRDDEAAKDAGSRALYAGEHQLPKFSILKDHRYCKFSQRCPCIFLKLIALIIKLFPWIATLLFELTYATPSGRSCCCGGRNYRPRHPHHRRGSCVANPSLYLRDLSDCPLGSTTLFSIRAERRSFEIAGLQCR